MLFFGVADLVERWCYSKQGIHNLANYDKNFPKPHGVINRGRNKFWHIDQIKLYEQAHPEVISQEAKQRKIEWYQRAWSKGMFDS